MSIDHLKDQLASLACDGDHILYRLIDLAKGQLDAALDDLAPDDLDELDGWLSRQFDDTSGAVRIRWGIIRGVFDSVRASLN